MALAYLTKKFDEEEPVLAGKYQKNVELEGRVP
jgi:hypothetical protein